MPEAAAGGLNAGHANGILPTKQVSA